MYSKTMTLTNGVIVPKLALGTQFIDDDKATEAVRQAVSIGYRHVDTAQAYANEELYCRGQMSDIRRKHCKIADIASATLQHMRLAYLWRYIHHQTQGRCGEYFFAGVGKVFKLTLQKIRAVLAQGSANHEYIRMTGTA